ncbi:hypothetical protein KIW84_052278 [Lathyrus oleraceus]|uniref:Uncharacterized protein n=1 Tax=Pisum sativum TaxID=3888 RepID=A0A9D5ABR2_PEA|nr:hypothetical protein KIW84_052278 [Pisum sativum]
MDVRYHWIHDVLDAKLLELAKVHTYDNVEPNNVGVKDANVGMGSNNVGEVHNEYSSGDSEDDIYQYDSDIEVAFEDDSDGYDEMEEDKLANLIGYESDGKGKGEDK